MVANCNLGYSRAYTINFYQLTFNNILITTYAFKENYASFIRKYFKKKFY
jgi:hypothetical protein